MAREGSVSGHGRVLARRARAGRAPSVSGHGRVFARRARAGR